MKYPKLSDTQDIRPRLLVRTRPSKTESPYFRSHEWEEANPRRRVYCKSCGAYYLDQFVIRDKKQLHTWECPDGLMPPEPFSFWAAGNKLPTGDRVPHQPYMSENVRPKKKAWHSKIPDNNALNKAVNKLMFVADHEDRMEEECECIESDRDCLKADAEFYAEPGMFQDCPGLVRSARAVLKRLGGPRLTTGLW